MHSRDAMFSGTTVAPTAASLWRRRSSVFLILALLSGSLVMGLLGVPASATFPGENGRIVFERQDTSTSAPPDIRSMEASGSDDQLVISGATESISNIPSPEWSPDGSQIAFSVTGTGGGIYTMNADGTNLQQITTGTTDHQPVFSPDGLQIAFSGNRNGGQDDILIVDMDSGDISQLTTNTGSAFDRDWYPDWSPDGSQIAFSRSLGTGAEKGIYLVSATGGSPVSITNGYDLSPSWSPDGTRIAFARDAGFDVNFTDDIWVVEPGEAPVNFTDDGSTPSDNEPSWSPDGNWIAYASAPPPDTPWEIYKKEYGPALPITERLTSNTVEDRDPDWGCGPSDGMENGPCEGFEPPPDPTDPADPGDSDGSSGALDESFGGGDGKVTTSFSPAEAQDVQVYADGSFIAVGYEFNADQSSPLIDPDVTQGSIAIAKYTSTGTLDTSFSGDGKRLDNFGSEAAGDAAVILPGGGGSFIVAGVLDRDFAAVKYTPTGTLDESFDINGAQQVDFGGFDVATGIGVLSDGSIILAGFTQQSMFDFDFALAKLTPTGTTDTSFGGGDGMMTVTLDTDDRATDLKIGADDTIYLSGSTGNSTDGFDWAFLAFDATGTADSRFGGDGVVTTSFSSDGEGANALAVDNGELVGVGGAEYSVAAGIWNFAIAKLLLPTGTFDTGFDGDGRVTRSLNPDIDIANDVAIHADGKIVAAGVIQEEGAQDFGVLRLESDGTPDDSFGGGDGWVQTNFDSTDDRANGVAIDSLGAIIAAGASCNGECAFAIAKYADGEEPPPEECPPDCPPGPFINWQGWGGLGGNLTSGPDVASWEPNRLDVFVRGGDNAVWHNGWDGSWSGYSSIGGILTSDPAAVSHDVNRIHVFGRGGDNALWQNTWNGSSWGGWTSLGGGLTSAPDATSQGPNNIWVFSRGLDNALWFRVWDGSTWGPWSSLGGFITSDPSAVASGNGTIDVYARGGDNALWTRTTFNNGLTWTPWISLGGQLVGGPDATAWNERVHVFARGTDDALWHIFMVGDNFGAWTEVGGVLRSDPGVAAWEPGRLDVFVRGADNALWHNSDPVDPPPD